MTFPSASVASRPLLIAIPFNPNEVWGVKQRHHITGSINGCAVRGSLGSDGSQYVLPLGAAWRRDSGVEVGVEVEVELTPEGPRADTLAPDIVAALATEPEARAFFESLATFYHIGPDSAARSGDEGFAVDFLVVLQQLLATSGGTGRTALGVSERVGEILASGNILKTIEDLPTVRLRRRNHLVGPPRGPADA